MSSSPVDPLNLLLFLGSVRQGRNAVRVGKFIQDELEERGHQVTVLDAKELELGKVEQPFHFYRNPAEAPEHLHKINQQIKDADGFVVVAAEYNSAIVPSLCAMMDHFPPASYSFRPSAIVTYSMGQFGGIRAAMQLRQYLSELTTVHMPSMVAVDTVLVIPKVTERISEDGKAIGEGTTILHKAVNDMISQLEWYGRIMKKERQTDTCPK